MWNTRSVENNILPADQRSLVTKEREFVAYPKLKIYGILHVILKLTCISNPARIDKCNN